MPPDVRMRSALPFGVPNNFGAAPQTLGVAQNFVRQHGRPKAFRTSSAQPFRNCAYLRGVGIIGGQCRTE